MNVSQSRPVNEGVPIYVSCAVEVKVACGCWSVEHHPMSPTLRFSRLTADKPNRVCPLPSATVHHVQSAVCHVHPQQPKTNARFS